MMTKKQGGFMPPNDAVKHTKENLVMTAPGHAPDDSKKNTLIDTMDDKGASRPVGTARA